MEGLRSLIQEQEATFLGKQQKEEVVLLKRRVGAMWWGLELHAGCMMGAGTMDWGPVDQIWELCSRHSCSQRHHKKQKERDGKKYSGFSPPLSRLASTSTYHWLNQPRTQRAREYGKCSSLWYSTEVRKSMELIWIKRGSWPQPHTSCVTLEKSLHLSLPQFSLPKSGDS